MLDPDAPASRQAAQPASGVRSNGREKTRSGPIKGRQSAAVKRYVQDTTDVIAYLRAPLKNADIAQVYKRIAAIALIESLTLFSDAMQHNPAWPRLEVPEPDLICVARGRAVPQGLRPSLELWMKALAQPAHRLFWCRGAFTHRDPVLESRYYALSTHAETAMFLMFEANPGPMLPRLGPDEVAVAERLLDNPVDLSILEKVRGLEPREFF